MGITVKEYTYELLKEVESFLKQQQSEGLDYLELVELNENMLNCTKSLQTDSTKPNKNSKKSILTKHTKKNIITHNTESINNTNPESNNEESLEKIQLDLGDCKRCRLFQERKNIVFGRGSKNAELMFIGEGPGAQEDIEGLPFVGRAGQLLSKIIKAMQFDENNVYIANIVKCRPPKNRDPHSDEINSCKKYLFRQIDSIKPRVIVTLGKPAASTLLENDSPMTAMRGNFNNFRGCLLMPTYHPAYLLRTPSAKRAVWEDMKQVMEIFNIKSNE